jgi:hypothetical protein
MNVTKTSWPLLDEYGLSEYLYDALICCIDPTYWKQGGLTHSITSLYKLRDRGLLSGPPTGKPYSVPFHLTDVGRDILARIERGLHKPEWLNENRARALRVIIEVNNGFIAPHSQTVHGFGKVTLQSLVRAGYIRQDTNIQWSATTLGREAWAEYKRAYDLPRLAGDPN